MQDFGLSEASEFMSEYWNVIVKHYENTNWENLISDCSQILENHRADFFKSLVFDYIDYLEAKRKEAKH